MYNIKTMNHISPCGLQKLEARGCNVGENVSDPDGLILRSADLHDYAFEPSLIAIRCRHEQHPAGRMLPPRHRCFQLARRER